MGKANKTPRFIKMLLVTVAVLCAAGFKNDDPSMFAAAVIILTVISCSLWIVKEINQICKTTKTKRSE